MRKQNDDSMLDDDPRNPREDADPDLDDEDGEGDTGEDEPVDETGESDEEQGEESEKPKPAPEDGERVTLTRAEFNELLRRGRSESPPPTRDREPDPMLADFEEVMADKSVPVSMKRVLARMHQRVQNAEGVARRATHEAVTVRGIPASHLPAVKAMAEKFDIPLQVAHQLYKGDLYDKAVERARTKRRGGDEGETKPEPTPERRGVARHTSIRPVRSGGGGGSSGPVVKVGGLTIPKRFESSRAYEKFMDGLPSDEARRIVYKARRDGIAGEVAG